MIRTVPIPTKVSRMGCAPGSGCCDECGSHTGPPIGPAASHTHAIPSNRNSALHARLGDLANDLPLPDDPGLQAALDAWAASTRSAADQTTLNALLLAGQTPPAAPPSTGGISPALMYIGAAVGFVVLLELLTRRR